VTSVDVVVSLTNASIGYSADLLFENLNLEVKAGELVAVVGPNGAGKTTLIKSILGLKKLNKGERKILGKIDPRASQLNHKVSFVPQRMSLNSAIPLTVFEFLSLKKVENNLSSEKLKTLFTEVDLDQGILEKSIHRLSGGQMQKVFLVFALIGNPQLIILDEVTEGLDVRAQESLFKKLLHLTENEKVTVIVISHDISAISHFTKRVLCINHRILYDGSPAHSDFHSCLHNMYGEKSLIHDHRH
jgi:zinc transport system ATP-binding protein